MGGQNPGALLLGLLPGLALVAAVGGAPGDAAAAQVADGEVLRPFVVVPVAQVPGIGLRGTLCERDARDGDGAEGGRHSSLVLPVAGHKHPGVSQAAGWRGRVWEKNRLKKKSGEQELHS